MSGQFAWKCVTLCQAGEEGRGGLRGPVLRALNDLCGPKERVWGEANSSLLWYECVFVVLVVI